MSSNIKQLSLSSPKPAPSARTKELLDLAASIGISKAKEPRLQPKGLSWKNGKDLSERYISRDSEDLGDFGSQGLEAEEIRDDSS